MSLSKYSNTELLDYPNCLGLSESGKCMWLSILKCQGYACPFLKTKGAHSTDRKAQIRLQSLDEEAQCRIAEKYYNGNRPWSQK